MHVELKHTITVPHNAWFMRLYRRVWSFTDEPSNPTFCSLFWGYLLMPLGLLLWVVLFCTLIPVAAAADYVVEHKTKAPSALGGEVKKQPSRLLRAFTVLAARIKFAWDFACPVLRVVGWGLVACAGLAALGGSGYGIYLLAPLVGSNVLPILMWIGFVLGGFLTIAILLWVGCAITNKWHLVARLGASLKTFGHVMAIGYVAVKSNTCPRIELR